MAFTNSEIKEIRDKLILLEERDQKDLEDIRIANLAVAEAWWDTIKPRVPQTRNEALTAYRFIQSEIETQRTNFEDETEPVQKEIFGFRLRVLNQKLKLANEKFIERKRNG